MKIALVVPGGVDRSGRERVIPALLSLIERLARRHDVHVIALEQEPKYSCYDLFGATVTNLGRARFRVLGAGFATRYRQLVRHIRDYGPFDVLHGFWAHGAGALAAMAGRRCRVPTVVSIGGAEFAALPDIEYGGQLHWRSRRQIAYAVRNARVVTAGSDYVIRQSGLRGVLWVPLGSDLVASSVRSYYEPGPPWRLLQIASINKVKDQFTALRALRILLDRGLDVEFDMVGEDTLGGELHRFGNKLSLSERVHFAGFRPHGDLTAFYANAHAYVQSSLHESQGVSVLEAASAGVPIVGTEVGLVAELAPSAAISVPVADPLRLADAIQRVLEGAELRAHLVQNALRFARTYNADWTCSRFEQLYAQACGYVAKPTTEASGMHTGATPAASARS